jgi:hypothetical protein
MEREYSDYTYRKMDNTLRKYGRQDNKEEDTDGDTNKAGRKAFKT